MSFRAVCKTEIDNQQDLKDALVAIYGEKHVKLDQESIIISVGSSHRSGRFDLVDGKYQLVYDSMDKHRFKDLMDQVGQNKKVFNRLTQEYSRVKVIKALRGMKNATIFSEETDENGKLRIRTKVKQ